jgi:hypothetical protein
VDRGIGERENRRRTEEAERQEQHEATQERTTAIARPLSAPPPPVHPESATAQLGLTPEEAAEVHKECIRAQEEIQEEIEEEDRVRHDWVAKADAHPDETKRVPTHPAAHSQPALIMHETLHEPPQATTLLYSSLIDHRDPPDHREVPTPNPRCSLPTRTTRVRDAV